MLGSAQVRAVERLTDLAVAGLDVESFWRAATDELAGGLAFDWRPCWFTLDPASLVITSHFNEDIPTLDPDVFENEYVDDDVNKMADLAASGVDVATLERATAGDRASSRRYRELLSQHGLGHELVAVLRSGTTSWASMTLYRAEGEADFAQDDLAFVRAVAPSLAEGARRGLLLGEAHDPPPDRPGSVDENVAAVVVVEPSMRVRSMTPSASRWLTRLGGSPGSLPSGVLAVVAAARDRSAKVPFARLRTRDGGWAFVHGSAMTGDDTIALIIEAASPERLGSLLMAAYGLSDREQEVTRHVLRGASTKEIGAALHLSPYTVQDHLKSIFGKAGVRSRRQLLATVFFDHFEPRVRDNEGRVSDGRMMRGGPLSRPRSVSSTRGVPLRSGS